MRFLRLPDSLTCVRLVVAGLALALASCAQQMQRQAAPVPAPATPGAAPTQGKAKSSSANAQVPAADVKSALPKQELTEAVLYEFLLAEIAGQRGAMALSAQAYADLAKRTRDPRIARRAAEVAIFARMPGAAVDAARIWYESEPASMQALQALISLLVSAKREDEAMPYLKQRLEKDSSGDSFLQLQRVFANAKDKGRALNLVRQLTEPYPGIAQARYALAQAEVGAGNEALALSEARKAAAIKPDWELPVLLEAQLLQRQSNALALERLAAFLKAYPSKREARMSYARLLVAESSYPEARAEFQGLLRDFPDDPDVVFAVGVLSLQLKDYALAQANFLRLLELPYRDKNAVRMYLGQIAEEQKSYADALHWYEEVTSGESYLRAQMRYALVLGMQGRLDEARAHLHQVEAQSSEAKVRLILTEAQLLRDANQPRTAFDLIENALKTLPDQPELLYDYAMLAEKLDRFDLLESNLRKLIRLQPEHAHAYNALGYSLADRNLRLPEAQTLIEKALQFSPEDPFIIDSMGWLMYRMGKNAQALEYLRKAYATRADPEIAAHLGEVLWATGARAEAEKIWDEARRKTPGNDALNSTIKRLKP